MPQAARILAPLGAAYQLWRENTGRSNPAGVSFPNREAPTFPFAPSGRNRSKRSDPRPHRHKITQATGIGNSMIIIDAGTNFCDTHAPVNGATGVPARPRCFRHAQTPAPHFTPRTTLLNSPHE